MAFDKTTRNRLAKFVADARSVIADEFTEQFQSLYGISPKGEIAPLDNLGHLDEAGLAIAAQLRERIVYLEKTHPDDKDGTVAAVARLAREQAFTILNRLAAIRMAEKRGLIVESVGKGYQSKGFKVFETVAGSALGDAYHRYRRYLFCLFDELAIDLGVLFDRRSPQALLFPREVALLALLDLLHAADLESLWSEDETIGWIYQYYNDPEERKKMRAESAAPRNSRELAVRNQFFTPRYVVEFLTDNTLGRIWYEMTKGQTRLAQQCRYLVRRPTEIFLAENETAPKTAEREDLSQEELLKQSVHIPHRPLKDPREIRLLDPACGSMHFGLYAFDLFETIYEEAWDNGSCPPLQKAYASKDEFLKDVPRLIIEHNIHGIDIDPRAVQIAGLSLWLRAQKAWQARGVQPTDRPRIRRSNIVCAEPMPGSPEMLEEFVATLDPPLLGELVKTVFEKMQLAGEAGSLLKIEEEIRSAIDTARKEWLKQQEDLLKRKDESQGEFFETAELQVINALRNYSEHADADSYQRRLFADDAARGFAFIDLCRKRYDAIVMNPPFGDAALSTKSFISKNYNSAKTDLAMAFVSMGLTRLAQNGLLSQITTRSFIGNEKLKKWRSDCLLGRVGALVVLVDLGIGVLDALVEACAYVVMPTRREAGVRFSQFFSELNVSDKGSGLLADIQVAPMRATIRSLNDFLHLPDQVMCYWLPESLLQFLLGAGSLRETKSAEVVQGMQTGDDFRFYRLRWEVPSLCIGRKTRWVPVCKGGEYSPFFDDIHLMADWQDEAKKIKSYIVQQYPYLNGDWGWVVKNSHCYFRSGLTYPERTASDFSPRVMPSGVVFTAVGMAIQSDQRESILGYLAGSYTRLFKFIVDAFLGSGDNSVSGSAAKHIRAGLLNGLPHPLPKCSEKVVKDALQAVEIRRFWLSFDEQTSFFVLPASIGKDSSVADALAGIIAKKCEDFLFLISANRRAELEQARYAGLDEQQLGEALANYGEHPDTYTDALIDADVARELSSVSEELLIKKCIEKIGARRQITKKSFIADRRLELCSHLLQVHPSRLAKAPAFILGQVNSASGSEASALVLYLVGGVFGRWDIRYGTGEHQPPELPDPFDPLPICPPGMLQNAEGLPAGPEDVPADYPLRISWPGILVDDENHSEDIVARVRETIEVIWKDRAEAIEQEACGILGVKTLRDYFRRPAAFFADHLKRYSKSRRQAPIYWPLSTKSGSYTLWLYYHRLNDQTLHTCLADFLDPKIRKVKSELDSFATSGGGGTRAGDLRELLEELQELRDEVERVIKLPWKPNLNDGVLITASPLHKLFRLPKWQKDLKACWDKLQKGKYDWAHLAYTIWPQRVEKACEHDRSIAIAHSLEHLCKVEPPKSKKKRGKKEAEEESGEDELELIEED